MKYICTLSDKRFLNRGLALIDSLNRYNDDIFVYYLCMDKEIHDILKNKQLKNVEVLFIDDIIRGDKRFDNIVPGEEAKHVADQSEISGKQMELCYKMSSYLPDYCFKNYNIDHLIFCDADIYFYKSLDSVYIDIKDKSFGVVEHRIPYTGCGKYNVGIVYMKNNEATKKILEFWKYCVLTPNNDFEKEYGTCGDQKYLELIYETFPEDIGIIGEKTGHLAPWNLRFHAYTKDEKIVWNNTIQDLVYVHFSNFKPNFENMTYEVGPRHGIVSVSQIPWLADKCNEYFINLKENNQ